jgi:hypothetical protein
MAQTTIRNYSVSRLWQLCRDYIFAIPEIQREFVWDRKRVANLFDSIWRQLPIGTLLIWETDADQRNLLRHAQQVLPPHRDHNKVIWFIIDGQQRLSALYRALEFPKALLRRHRFSVRETNSLCNLCFVVAEENQSIGSKKPAVYLKELRRPRFFPSVMRSHLIPHKGNSGLWDTNLRRGYKRFLSQRLDMICKAFEKEAGMRLFKRDWKRYRTAG